jgi:hypothetical protein
VAIIKTKKSQRPATDNDLSLAERLGNRKAMLRSLAESYRRTFPGASPFEIACSANVDGLFPPHEAHQSPYLALGQEIAAALAEGPDGKDEPITLDALEAQYAGLVAAGLLLPLGETTTGEAPPAAPPSATALPPGPGKIVPTTTGDEHSLRQVYRRGRVAEGPGRLPRPYRAPRGLTKALDKDLVEGPPPR